ncbi:MAG: prepilin-type N-terminal cleavage/methylation domain-containing protein [Pirellulales bacterium]|nr:prepilin-type N-terminal cleavage/methylation domain-containing protein [Pirellulales bacterium]
MAARLPARGYTLLEMIIVVAIVALLVALTMPAMRGPLGKSELRGAAKQVRTALAGARLRAIESGVAQQFHFQPGGNRFEVVPRPTRDAGMGLPFSSGQATRRIAAAVPRSPEEPEPDQLPGGVRFVGQQTAEPSPEDSPQTVRLDAESWSPPIVFYPNGRTTNARIRLNGSRGFYADVLVRGVTGAATVGELKRRQLQP